MDSDSDSDIEIVYNSVDKDAGNHPLSSSSSSASSLHSLSKRRVLHHQRSSSSKTTTTSRTAAAASTTTTTIPSKLPQSSSSDIELISGPSTLSHRDASTKRGAGTDLTNRIGRGSSSTSASSKRASSSAAKIGGFKSASAILKDQAKEARRRSSSAVSSDAATGAPPSKSRDVSPALSSSSSSDIKGKKRDVSLPPPLKTQAIEQEPRHLEDEDDDIVELPPPSQIPIINVKEQSPIASLLDEAMPSSSPVAAFRNTLNRFKAPSIPQNTRSSSNRSSMFAGNNGSRDTSSSVIAVLSDSSNASTSTSLSSSTRSRFTNKASTSSSITDQLQIPTPFLAIITRCPTCDAEWTVTKDPKVKLNHIRKCSITKSYSHHEIDALVEKQVRNLQALAEERNRKIHEGRTLLEGVLSKKGKDVLVIGVEGRDVANSSSEKKGKGKAQNETEGEMDEMDNLEARQVVLSTQGGSTYSQATSTQVQKELNKRIKTAQRIGRGDFLNVPSTANIPLSDHSSHSASEGSGSDAQGRSNNGKSILEEAFSKSRKKKGSANVSGVGSKNWLKAAQLLKAKDKETSSILGTEMDGDTSHLSTAHIGASISSTFTSSIDSAASGKMKGGGAKGRKQRDTSANLANRLVSYEESRYRLSEKVKNIASSRATRRRSDTSSIASDPVDNAVAATVKTDADEPIRPLLEGGDTSLMRPYRNPSDLEICLLDKAIRRGVEKRKSGYDAWDLAGSVEDSDKNRYVSQSPSLTSPSTPQPAARCHRVSSNDLSDTNMHPSCASRNMNVITAHPVNPSTSVPTPPSSPPIDKLSLDSPSATRFPGVPTDTTQSPSGPIHILLPSSRNYLGPSFTSSTATIDNFRSVVTHSPISTAPNADANGLNTTNSSNGLFESSAALQALTQKLKATSSSSTKPILAQRRAAAAAAASLAKKSSAVLPGTPSSLLPNAMASMQLYASTSTSTVSTLSMRTYATKTEELGGRDDLLDLLEENAEKPKRARPKKTWLDSDESATVAQMSPKRKKRQNESSGTSDAEEAVNKPVKQDTLAFKATKIKKASTTKVTTTSPKVRKKASTDVPSPRKKKATSAYTTEAPANDYASTHPGMPDYDNWSKEELQAETGKYGYKPAGTKKVLVSQLIKVWEAIHPEQFPVEETVESVPPWRRSASPESAKKGKGKAKAKAADLESDIVSDSSGVSMTPGKKKAASTKKKKKAVTAASPKKKKATTAKGKAIAAAMAKRKAASSGSDPDGEESDIHAIDEVGEEEIDTDESPEVLKSAGERMREAILKDEKFYLRILRYEPIQFDDFEMILDAEKIKMSKIALRDWLDTQGITFYYDQNNGRNAARRGRKKRAAAK